MTRFMFAWGEWTFFYCIIYIIIYMYFICISYVYLTNKSIIFMFFLSKQNQSIADNRNLLKRRAFPLSADILFASSSE